MRPKQLEKSPLESYWVTLIREILRDFEGENVVEKELLTWLYEVLESAKLLPVVDVTS